jgi:hypothetical protein
LKTNRVAGVSVSLLQVKKAKMHSLALLWNQFNMFDMRT